jgi:DNA (cytosine-5)-methyltransferase 1
MQLISLFSGIGGFELASEWMGWDNVVSCEINPFGQRVLKYYWPDAYHYDDIHTLTYEKIKEQSRWDESKTTILVGGFPCQPYSAAGKRLGEEDDRHLWPEMLRIIREVKPAYVVGENVFGLVNWSDGLVFEEVQADLEAEGYEVQPYILPAASVGAPHRRDRVWFVAKNTMRSGCVFGELEQNRTDVRKQRNVSTRDSNGICREKNAGFVTHANHKGRTARLREVQSSDGEIPERHDYAELGNASDGFIADANYQRRQEYNIATKSIGNERITGGNNESAAYTEQSGRERRERLAESKRFKSGAWDNWPTVEPTIRRDYDGFSSRLVGITFSKHRNESIKAYGNAIVPQVVYQIFKAIQAYEDSK